MMITGRSVMEIFPLAQQRSNKFTTENTHDYAPPRWRAHQTGNAVSTQSE